MEKNRKHDEKNYQKAAVINDLKPSALWGVFLRIVFVINLVSMLIILGSYCDFCTEKISVYS